MNKTPVEGRSYGKVPAILCPLRSEKEDRRTYNHIARTDPVGSWCEGSWNVHFDGRDNVSDTVLDSMQFILNKTDKYIDIGIIDAACCRPGYAPADVGRMILKSRIYPSNSSHVRITPSRQAGT